MRKTQFLWLALIPLGAVGALATGIMALPWQFSAAPDKISAVTPPGKTRASDGAARQGAPAGKRPARADQPTGAPADSPKVKTAASARNPSRGSADKSVYSGGDNPFGIDIARINGEGSSVIAGYANPGTPVTIFADGSPIGAVTADTSGDWVFITPHKFASMDPKLSLKAGDHMPKTVTALANDQSAAPSARLGSTTRDTAPGWVGSNATARSATAAPKRTAEEVTRQMLQRLRKLTEEANAKARASGAGDAAGQVVASPQPVSADDANRPTAVAERATSAGTDISPARPRIGEAGGAARPAVTAAAPVRTATAKRNTTPADGAVRVAAALPKPSAPSTPPAPTHAKPSHGDPMTASTRETAAVSNLPVPVQFVYRKAELTEKGREAAKLLLAYLKAKRFKHVVLSGHADERGTRAANMALSRQRLGRIEELLRTGGFGGDLELVPKGESEKYTGVDRSQFDIEELWQLDRRVEVVSAE